MSLPVLALSTAAQAAQPRAGPALPCLSDAFTVLYLLITIICTCVCGVRARSHVHGVPVRTCISRAEAGTGYLSPSTVFTEAVYSSLPACPRDPASASWMLRLEAAVRPIQPSMSWHPGMSSWLGGKQLGAVSPALTIFSLLIPSYSLRNTTKSKDHVSDNTSA